MKKKTSNDSQVSFKRNRGLRIMGLRFNTDGAVKGFFGGNAYLAILFLLFICIFLFKSAIGFIPNYRTELSEARTSGIEASNHFHYELVGYDSLYTKINQAFIHERRTQFSELETIVPLYEEFESIIDDELEDEVDEHALLDDGPEKEASATILKQAVTEACAELDPQTLLKTIQQRLPSTTEISETSYSKALLYAQEYALNDYETPEAVDQIPAQINAKMKQFNEAVSIIKTADDELRQLYIGIEKKAQLTYSSIAGNRKNKASIETLTEALDSAADDSNKVTAIKKRINELKTKIKPIDTENNIQAIYTTISKHDVAADHMINQFQQGVDILATADIKTDKAQLLIKGSSRLFIELKDIVTSKKQQLAEWKHDKSVTTWDTLTAFFFGSNWKTGSERQNLYGLLPLFSGSLLISLVAMIFAVPLAVGAAIYVNQFAYKKEASLLKPIIEFIQAIPSVVLGLFGVLVVASLLQTMSESSFLSWIPGFPIQNRLNVLLAGLLLAFMAAPTIFTLAEDALNNVPKAYTEASLAMGANKLQTTLKVIVPSCLSGIVAAIMLGFGRVIGETMVVLLVAGNKAKIPDLSQGIGLLGESVHTMTGIIAQEYGEVEPGVLHWKALFMVGLVLFLISLSINSICQRIIARKAK